MSESASEKAGASAEVVAADGMGGGRGEDAALTTQEQYEYAELRRENKILRVENTILQRKLEEERAQRRQSQNSDNHYSREVQACKESIENLSENAQVLVLHEELHRLRRKCDIYAEAIEESRNNFFEMQRLYMEVKPYLLPSSSESSSHTHL